MVLHAHVCVLILYHTGAVKLG